MTNKTALLMLTAHLGILTACQSPPPGDPAATSSPQASTTKATTPSSAQTAASTSKPPARQMTANAPGSAPATDPRLPELRTDSTTEPVLKKIPVVAGDAELREPKSE